MVAGERAQTSIEVTKRLQLVEGDLIDHDAADIFGRHPAFIYELLAHRLLPAPAASLHLGLPLALFAQVEQGEQGRPPKGRGGDARVGRHDEVAQLVLSHLLLELVHHR